MAGVREFATAAGLITQFAVVASLAFSEAAVVSHGAQGGCDTFYITVCAPLGLMRSSLSSISSIWHLFPRLRLQVPRWPGASSAAAAVLDLQQQQ